MSAVPRERAAVSDDVVSELVFNVGHHSVVCGGGAAEYGDAARQHVEHPRDAPIVGAEVMAPIADAMHLVDDQQAGVAGDSGKLV